jgi:hypothetical protein
VHLHHLAASGPLVQQVDVLRDHRLHQLAPLELREREVRRVRLRLREHRHRGL